MICVMILMLICFAKEFNTNICKAEISPTFSKKHISMSGLSPCDYESHTGFN